MLSVSAKVLKPPLIGQPVMMTSQTMEDIFVLDVLLLVCVCELCQLQQICC